MHSVTTGDMLVDSVDLGHKAGVKIHHLVLPRASENRHFVLTADDSGEMRIHDFKVVAKKASGSRWTSSASSDDTNSSTAAEAAKMTASSADRGPKELATYISDR